MRELRIVLCGDHGMELDHKVVDVRPGADQAAVLANAMRAAIADWTLDIGDTIKIVEA